MAEFSVDWTTPRYDVWKPLLATLKDRSVSILEVGSWEGRSAVFFLDYLPRSTIVCIDSFVGEPSLDADMAKIEQRFDANLQPYGTRVRKIKASSATGLATLLDDGTKFDLIYLDGSHRPEHVLIDTALAWPMLNVGGILIWDDYQLVRGSERPRETVDLFLTLQRGNYELLNSGWQCLVRKTTDSPPPPHGRIKRRLLRMV